MKIKRKTKIILIASSCLSMLQLPAVTVFSNNFEDGDLNPETGIWTFAPGTSTTSVVSTSAADATLGSQVGLLDQVSTTGPSLDLSLDLSSTVSLSAGDTVSLDFDYAARRTSGNTKTVFLDALDSSGAIVARIVLGDTNAFGNGGNDRQRLGYDPDSTGNDNTNNSTLPGPNTPGSFWWGSDANVATFDVNRDAHISVTYGETGFDISSTSQTGVVYSTTGLSNYDGGTFADIASFEFSSAGGNYGFWLDNVIVDGVVIPEPSSVILLSFAGLGFLTRRQR